jgi:hypothetical protein
MPRKGDPAHSGWRVLLSLSNSKTATQNAGQQAFDVNKAGASKGTPVFNVNTLKKE